MFFFCEKIDSFCEQYFSIGFQKEKNILAITQVQAIFQYQANEDTELIPYDRVIN